MRLFRVLFSHVLSVSKDEDFTAPLIQSLTNSTAKFFFPISNQNFPCCNLCPLSLMLSMCTSAPKTANLVQHGINISHKVTLLTHVQLDVCSDLWVFIRKAAFYPVNPQPAPQGYSVSGVGHLHFLDFRMFLLGHLSKL